MFINDERAQSNESIKKKKEYNIDVITINCTTIIITLLIICTFYFSGLITQLFFFFKPRIVVAV